MSGYNHLHPFSVAEGEQFRAEIAQVLAELPDEQFIALLNDLRECQSLGLVRNSFERASQLTPFTRGD